jgi:hypothetical protein
VRDLMEGFALRLKCITVYFDNPIILQDPIFHAAEFPILRKHDKFLPERIILSIINLLTDPTVILQRNRMLIIIPDYLILLPLNKDALVLLRMAPG